jgi:single-strand DNA-binding protein
VLPVVQGEFRAAADPELRFAPSGTAVGSVRAVASKRKKNDANEWVDDKTCWVRITAFNQLAENLVESITKGTAFLVSGKLSTEEWEDKDGNKRISVEIVADNIGPSLAFATAKVSKTERRSGGDGGGQQQQPAQQQSQGSPWETQGSDDPPF